MGTQCISGGKSLGSNGFFHMYVTMAGGLTDELAQLGHADRGPLSVIGPFTVPVQGHLNLASSRALQNSDTDSRLQEKGLLSSILNGACPKGQCRLCYDKSVIQ